MNYYINGILTIKAKNLGWIAYQPPKGKLFFNEKVPPKLVELLKLNEVFKYPAKLHLNMICYKGDLNTTNEWIIVCSGAEFYKVGTKFAVWASRSHNLTEGKLYLGCEYGPINLFLRTLDSNYFY